jgi:predicted RNA-binding protein YlqC (UPF0109 family)
VRRACIRGLEGDNQFLRRLARNSWGYPRCQPRAWFCGGRLRGVRPVRAGLGIDQRPPTTARVRAGVGDLAREERALGTEQDTAQAAVLELVQRVVVALVDRPELVKVVRVSGERAVVIEITAVPPEVGQVIGRGGRNIHALQAIAQAVAAKHGVECQIVVLDRPQDADPI